MAKNTNTNTTTYINATVALQDHDGNNQGLLNLAGDFTNQADATEAVEGFCRVVSKLTDKIKETIKFVPFTKEGKTQYRLAKSNNQTVGFVNSDKHNLEGWNLSNVTVEPYSQTNVTDEDWETFLV